MNKNQIRIESDDLTFQNQGRLLDKIKNQIFMTYFQILEAKKLSENIGILLIVILFIQMISMSFNENNIDLSKSMISGLLPLPNYLLLYPIVLSSSAPLFNILILVFTLIIFLFLFLSIFYISSKANEDSPFLKNYKELWGFLSELTDKILVAPVIGLTVGNLSCQYSNEQMECLSGMQIAVMILCVINTSLMLTLELLYVYLFFNFTFKVTDSFARNPSGMQILFLMCRVVITVFQSRFDQSVKSNYTMTVLLHLLYGLILCYDSLNQFPYHNKNVSKANGLFSAAYLWINGTFLLLQISSIEMLHENILIIVGLGMAFFVKLFLNIRNFNVKVLMNSELDNIKSDVLVDVKLRTYNNLAKTLDIKKSELLLASLLKIHYDKCQDQLHCPCRTRQKLLDPKRYEAGDQKIQLHKDKVFVKHFIIKMIRDGLSKFKDSKLLHLDLMFYRFEALRIYASIYFEIMKFEDKYHNDMSLSIEFCLYRLGAMLNEYIQNRNIRSQVSERLKVENVRSFDEGIIQIRKHIMTVNRNFNDLWESLQDLVPDLALILEIGNKAIKNIQITNDLYERLILLNSESQDLKNLMDIYSVHLIFDDLLSFKVSKDIDMPNVMEVDNSIDLDLDQALKNYNIFDQNSCVISISPRLENQGQILWCSRNVHNIFGYSESEMPTLNINHLMPEPISIHHNRVLRFLTISFSIQYRYFYDNGREHITNSVKHLWAMDVDRVCFSANISLKILPSLKGFDLMGFVHKLNSDDYMVTDMDGMLYGVGNRVAQLIDLKPKIVSSTRFNIQLLAPRLMSVYKKFFYDFDDIALPNQQTDGKILMNYEKSKIEEIKFFFFIPLNIQEKVNAFAEARLALFRKYNIDLITKERTVQQNIYQQAGIQQINSIKQLIKQALEFKSSYANLLHRMNRKIQTKQLKKIVKVKAQIKYFTFWNGEKQTTLCILKLGSYEVKNPEYAESNIKKVKAHEMFVQQFIQELKKEHNEYRTKKIRMHVEVEQDQEEEIENHNNLEQAPVVNNPIKGYANLFKKQGQGKSKGNSFFQKMNKFGNIMGRQSSGILAENAEQQENKLKGAILMTLFKPSSKKLRSGKRAVQMHLNKNQSSFESSPKLQEIKRPSDIVITQAQIEKMKQCKAVVKILNALAKSQIIGISEFSAFYIRQQNETKIEREKQEEEKELIQIIHIEEKGKALLRTIIKSSKFKDYMKSHVHAVDSDQTSDHEDNEYRLNWRSENSYNNDQDEERDLIKALERKENQQDDINVQASIGSSSSSLQTHNALRLLRESLKQMKAPRILITANYLIITLCILIICLTLVQYIEIKKSFTGLEEELMMYSRVSYYAESIGELYNGYLTLEMINSKTLSDQIYNSTWQSDYRMKLSVELRDLVTFFLDDFSQAGIHSISLNDLRGYMFQSLNVSTLINQSQKSLEFNFQNYVRLFTNAVNQTLELPLEDFSINPTTKSDYFYFIQANFNSYLDISERNYEQVSTYMVQTLDNLSSRFVMFWIFSFMFGMICYIFLYPIILKTKITIHETLRIFTKISIKDVEHYGEHYKRIFFLFKTLVDSSDLIARIDDDIMNIRLLYLRSKAHDSKALSRSRNHKGIKINKVLFFFVMTLYLSAFSSIILVKDFNMIKFISQAYDLNDMHVNQNKMIYLHESTFMQYRQTYHNYLINGTIDQQQINWLITRITSYNSEFIMKQNLNIFGEYSELYKQFIQGAFTQDLCIQVLDQKTYQQSTSLEQCQSLNNKLLQRGAVNFYTQLNIEMLNGLNMLSQFNSTQDDHIFALNEIQNIKYKDYLEGLQYIKYFGSEWQQIEREAFVMGINKQITYNLYFVVILSVSTFLFLTLIWMREYNQLKKSSKWVNGFILLIPINILKENQYIRSFLKKKLNVQSLMYI